MIENTDHPVESSIMPVPAVLQGASYAHVWTGQLDVTGKSVGGQAPVKERNFITYIEVREQGAHDPEIRSLWQEIIRQNPGSPAPRPMHEGRVNPRNAPATRLTYYQTHGQMAASMASQELTRKWDQNRTNNTVFTRGMAHQLTQLRTPGIKGATDRPVAPD
ncbi:hypothetical protein [Novosphingobium sp.]|uniref:hypothetical protein n=1 Tax=Novosphingobium sp. TaxID=1874826 RepID=UPI001D1D346B|nr:hypothetical protein [Novosphingobium sp.]MBX9661953.1 hypothetical protein [Novosphingobium sp.]